jgi:UrcA family protein
MIIIKSIPGSFRPLALVALAGILGSSPGWASPPSVTVKFGDLDLNSTAGATTLYHRIHSAAKAVCGTAGTQMVQIAQWQGCVKDATSDAIARVNNPLLTSIYTGKPAVPATAMLTK